MPDVTQLVGAGFESKAHSLSITNTASQYIWKSQHLCQHTQPHLPSEGVEKTVKASGQAVSLCDTMKGM